MPANIRSARAKMFACLALTTGLFVFLLIHAPAAKTPSQSDFGMEVIRLVNEERAKVNLPPLVYDEALLPVAELRAQEASRKFSHTRPNGEPWSTAFTDMGVFGHRGENLAYGQKNPKRVVAAWMASKGHRANILNERYTSLAVGVFKKGSTIYWAQAFLGDPNVLHAVPDLPDAAEPQQAQASQAESPSAAVYVRVKPGAELNLRAEGSSRGKKLGVMSAGTQLELLESANGWAHVRTSDGLEGWCSEKYLTK